MAGTAATQPESQTGNEISSSALPIAKLLPLSTMRCVTELIQYPWKELGKHLRKIKCKPQASQLALHLTFLPKKFLVVQGSIPDPIEMNFHHAVYNILRNKLLDLMYNLKSDPLELLISKGFVRT